MLWKPINWLLSNCLSFSLCPCPGLSVQTLHPARGDAGNAPELSRSKAHICSKVEDTQPLQLQCLRHICESGSSGHIGSERCPKAAQPYLILYKATFIKAASLLPPLWLVPQARWYWNVAERQVLFCFFFLQTGTLQPPDLWGFHCWVINFQELLIKWGWFYIYRRCVHVIIHLKWKVQHSLHPVERIIVKNKIDPFQHLPFYHFLSQFLWCEDG